LFGGIGYWAWTSPVFEVSNIKVEGTNRLDTAVVAASTNLFGDRMFTADLAAAQQTLQEIPLVASAEIRREWPDTIRITVVERQAWGTWLQHGLTYTIDRDGVVIDAPAPEDPVVIVSNDTGPLGLGERVDFQAVDSAAEIYERLPRQLGTTVAEIRFLGIQGVQVTTADGRIGYLGDSGGMSYKLAAWAATAAEAERQGLSYTSIDLRHGNRPVLQ
jgi:cell division protein FtsQ